MTRSAAAGAGGAGALRRRSVARRQATADAPCRQEPADEHQPRGASHSRRSILPPMRAVDLIRTKRDGGALSRDADRIPRARRHRRHAARLPGLRAADGDRPARHDAGRDGAADRRDGAFRRARRPLAPPRRQGRQAQHRRRRRQDVADPRAAGRRVRRRRADDVGPRARPHRRHARQARIDPRVPHRRCRSTSSSGCSTRSAAA